MRNISSKEIGDNVRDIGLYCSPLQLNVIYIVYLSKSVDPRRLQGNGCILLRDGIHILEIGSSLYHCLHCIVHICIQGSVCYLEICRDKCLL